MKKKLSVREFGTYLTTHKPSSISFWTENQSWYDPADPCKIRVTSTIMLIHENPNVIYLKWGSDNEICFNHIRYIEIDENSTVLGTIITVACGDFGSRETRTSYTLIAS